MREAIGGSWILYIFFVIIFIFVCFMAFVMNYASAYRTNNYIISAFEQYEGNQTILTKSNLQKAVKQNYGYTGDISCCCESLSNGAGVVYKIKTYVEFEVPLIGTFPIGITTDSKTVYNGVCTSTNQFCSKCS